MNITYAEAREQLTKELYYMKKGWISLHYDTSTLDGDFTSNDLRIIANKMDELKEIYRIETKEK